MSSRPRQDNFDSSWRRHSNLPLSVGHHRDHDRAIADLDRGLQLAPASEALTIRGFAWKRKGDKEKAMADFDEAIRLNPREALAWRVRGATWAGKADYQRALADYTESLRIDPENPETLHHRATMLSACTDARYRDGRQAVEDATKACELTEWKSPLFLNGLASAYAEKGDFDSAIGDRPGRWNYPRRTRPRLCRLAWSSYAKASRSG